MENGDRTLVEKLNAAVSGGLSESGAIQFLAILSISEYDRLIEIFRTGDTGISVHTRQKLVIILEKLREAKRNKKA